MEKALLQLLCEHTSSKGAKYKSKVCFLFLSHLQAQLKIKKITYNSKAGSISKALLYAQTKSATTTASQGADRDTALVLSTRY